MLPRRPVLIIVQNLPVPLDRRLWLTRTHLVTLEPHQLHRAIGARRRVQNVGAASMLNADLTLGNATNTEPK